MGDMNWFNFAQAMDKWQAAGNMVINLQVPHNV
jgi:predicted extracellular nuclease